MVTNELPQSKEDVIVKKCRELLHDIRCNPSFETIHAWNTYVVGVHNYYKGMSLFCLSFRKIGWRIKNSRLAMFRISKYSSMKGVSYLSGNFVPVDEYHCHHIKPLSKGGTNDFDNLCVLSETEHMILHSSTPERLYSMFPRKIRRIKSLIDSLQRD